MVHRGTTRESRKVRVYRISTTLDKIKRHRRKARIWRRAVKRLAEEIIYAPDSAIA